MKVTDTRVHPHQTPEDLRVVMPDSANDEANQIMREAAEIQVRRITGENAATILRILGLKGDDK